MHQGLFRVPSSATRINKLKAAMDANVADLNDYENDVHSVAGWSLVELHLEH